MRLQGLCEILGGEARRLRSSLFGWVQTCRDRRMRPQTGSTLCKIFPGGGEDPVLGLALLRGLHLSWARDLGDAFATEGRCSDAGWGPRAPQQRWAHDHDAQLLGAALISPPPSPRSGAAPNAHPGQLSRPPLTAAPHKGLSVAQMGGTARDGTEGTLPSSSGTLQMAKPWVSLDAR